MLEELFNLVKDHSQDDIINNQHIPNEHNSTAVGMATDSIFSGLQGALANGGVGSILSLLGGKSSVGGSNPLVNGIMQNFAGGLMSKFGITNPIAQSIAASLIPKALSGLVGRTSNPQDSGFNVNGLIGSLMGQQSQASNANPIANAGGSGFDFNSLLSQITGGAQVQAPTGAAAHDTSGFGMDDILKMVTGGAQQQQQAGGGGIADILKMVTGGAQQQQQQQQQSGGGVMDLLKGFMGS
jgi:hypothetical protein